jgi:IS30 family transposase
MIERKKYVCLDFEKRCLLEKYLKAGFNIREIADKLGTSEYTIHYELRKNNMTAANYDAATAQKYKLRKKQGAGDV